MGQVLFLPANESSIEYVNEMLDVMKGKKFQIRARALKWDFLTLIFQRNNIVPGSWNSKLHCYPSLCWC